MLSKMSKLQFMVETPIGAKEGVIERGRSLDDKMTRIGTQRSFDIFQKKNQNFRGFLWN